LDEVGGPRILIVRRVVSDSLAKASAMEKCSTDSAKFDPDKQNEWKIPVLTYIRLYTTLVGYKHATTSNPALDA
jgi:hypothetical protein